MSHDVYYFSNGTEHDIWADQNCNRCIHDIGGDCPHILAMIVGEYDPVFIRVPDADLDRDVLQCTELNTDGR